MSFRVRLIISFALLISLTFGVGGTLLISTSFHSILEEEKRTILSEYETIQNNLVMLIHLSEDYNNMHELLYQMETQNIAHWQAISLESKGLTIYESGDRALLSFDADVEESPNYAYVHTIDQAGRRLQLYSELTLTEYDTLYLKASFDLSAAYVLRERQQILFLMIYFVVVALGIVIAGIIAYVLTNRLERLTVTARQIADGNMSVRTNLKTGDEFEQLSGDFDRMTDKLQENIQKLEEDVQRKEAFMGAVAHELKTPLTSIIGYADMVRQCSLNEEEQMMAANYIYTEGKLLEKLSHKILELLLMENDTLIRKKVKLQEFFIQIQQMLLPIAEEKGVDFLMECEPVTIYIEPDLGKSLFYNLIDNAIKATGKGGTVRICGKANASGCEIQILDDGCGMEETELGKITEAFYRVDKSRSRQQGGVGLGLTLCKKIVDLHQGSMTFQSQKGKGSCVTVQLFGCEKDCNRGCTYEDDEK